MIVDSFDNLVLISTPEENGVWLKWVDSNSPLVWIHKNVWLQSILFLAC
jgi:hypothetical protein